MNEKQVWRLYEVALKHLVSKFPRSNFDDREHFAMQAAIIADERARDYPESYACTVAYWQMKSWQNTAPVPILIEGNSSVELNVDALHAEMDAEGYPTSEKDFIRMFIEGRTQREIAKALGWDLEKVNKRLKNGIE